MKKKNMRSRPRKCGACRSFNLVMSIRRVWRCANCGERVAHTPIADRV